MVSSDYDDLEKRVAALEAIVMGEVADVSPKLAGSDVPDWNINERAFVSRYAHGKSGEKKFTLLVAYLAKGDVTAAIELSAIQAMWAKMIAVSLLGSKFNAKYPTVAKTRGWVNSPEKGTYQLAYGWEEALHDATK